MSDMSNFNIGSIIGASNEETELMSKQIELLSLKAKQTVLKTQKSNALEATYKSLMDSSEKTLNETKATVAQLKKGWYAAADGLVSSVNIAAGQKYEQPSMLDNISGVDLTTLLSGLTNGGIDLNSILSAVSGSGSAGGITVEYYDSFIATFSLGKYDILDVKVGQKAVITSLGQEYEGEIIYVSPVASTGSSIDISSILGSMAGSSTGSTIEARVLIKEPDDHIIVGLDVDISIDIETVEDAVVVPIESVLSDSTGHYIYLYDGETKTVSKTEVKLGLTSDTGYQILSGCKSGDTIVRNQSSSLEDGAKVNAKTSEDTTAV